VLTFIPDGGVHDTGFGGEHDPARAIDIETGWPSLIEFGKARYSRGRDPSMMALVNVGRAAGWTTRPDGRQSAAGCGD
jgi:hypothetical protein